MKVTWNVLPDQDLEITANIIAGLVVLARNAEIELELKPARADLKTGHAMVLTASQLGDSRERTIVVDVLDRADAFDGAGLAIADRYFKCNFQSGHLGALSAEARGKVLPLGLALLSAVDGSRSLKLRAISKSLRASHMPASAVHFRNTATWLIKSIGRLYGIVKLSDMVREELDASERQVVFQPRAWNESSEGKRVANAYRGDIVRLLRAEFGSSDRIGFTHSKVRSSLDPVLQLSSKVTRAEYVRQLAKSAIGVNTRGLNDSSTFKLSEYLAAGMAIVSDPMKFELPEPLVEGVHYLGYNSPSECVQRCRELVAKPDLLLAMRTANREYFKRNLDPEAQVRYLINATFEDLSAGDAR